MSKAFTREDDFSDEPILPRPLQPLPAGLKNYLTADGAKSLREELVRLIQVERPLLLAGEPDTVKRELQLLDQRVAYLAQSLDSAEIVSPPSVAGDVVRFGANVTVRGRSGEQSQYRIVGIDETDIDRGWVSWRSPIARA